MIPLYLATMDELSGSDEETKVAYIRRTREDNQNEGSKHNDSIERGTYTAVTFFNHSKETT